MSRRTLLTALTAFGLSACSKAVFLAANVPASFGSYQRHADIAYGDGPAHRLDVYVPTMPPRRPMPLVVFWYGGRWSSGDKSDYRFVGAALAELGYVVMLPNYRHYPQVKLAGFMEDAARGARWAVEHGAEFGADPQQLFLTGHSAGAHLAALLSLDHRYFLASGAVPPIAGVAGLSGPYDFLPLTDLDLQDMFGPPANYPNSQPIDFVRVGAPPMLLIQGLADESVAPKNAINLAAALRAVGDTVTLKLYPNLKHADTVAALSIPARRRAPTLADIAEFVDSVVSRRRSS